MARFLPYGRQWIDDDDLAAVARTLKADYLAQGPEVERLESKICEITGAKYCVVLSNATAGLHLAVTVLGLAPGDEGITVPITFVASANCMAYNGLVPRFADIDPRTYCMDPSDAERRPTPRTSSCAGGFRRPTGRYAANKGARRSARPAHRGGRGPRYRLGLPGWFRGRLVPVLRHDGLLLPSREDDHHGRGRRRYDERSRACSSAYPSAPTEYRRTRIRSRTIRDRGTTR